MYAFDSADLDVLAGESARTWTAMPIEKNRMWIFDAMLSIFPLFGLMIPILPVGNPQLCHF